MIVHGMARTSAFKANVPTHNKFSKAHEHHSKRPTPLSRKLCAVAPAKITRTIHKRTSSPFELCLPLLSPMGRPDGREEVTVFSSTNYEDCVTVVSDLLKKMAEANCLSGIGFKIYFYQGDRARDALEMAKACSEEAE